MTVQTQTGKPPFLQKIVKYLANHEIRNELQCTIIDPMLDHILKRIFPYIILTCVLFALLLLAVLLTLGIIVFQLRGGAQVAAVVATAGSLN